MTVTSIEYKDFRNLAQIALRPSDGVNVIYGENAQGKTNLIEGIWLFSGMKSFRGAKDAELVRFGQEFGRLKIAFEANGRPQKAEMTVTARRSVRLNGVELPSCAGMIGKFSAVVFSPSCRSIVKNGPEERRRFLDAAICQLKPGYAAALAEYHRLIRQRNSLLKDIRMEPALLDMLDVIDRSAAATGEALIEERRRYIEALLPHVKQIYGGFTDGRDAIALRYLQKEGGRGTLEELFRENRKADIINKTTSVGPHRDDIAITINGISARSYGSQGQQRSCAIALKLGEAAVMKETTGEQPVVLLDDVMSELDAARQDYILNRIQDRQVFITCCEPSAVMRPCAGSVFHIEKGGIIE